MPLNRLSLRVQHAPHEPAYGLLARIALRHGSCSVEDFVKQIKFLPKDFSKEVARGHSLEILSELSGFSEQVISAHTFEAEGGFVATLLDPSQKIYSGRLPRSHPRICASCLSDDIQLRLGPVALRPFRRFWWDVSAIYSCPKHRRLLRSDCATCGSSLNRRSLDLRHCSCGADLTIDDSPRLGIEHVEADSYLVGRLINDERRPKNAVLDDLVLSLAARVMLNVGRASLWDSELPGIHWMSPFDRARSCAAGFRALSNWPNNFRLMLDNLISRPQSSTRRSSVATCYGQLYTWLDKAYQPELKPLRDAISHHAETHFLTVRGIPLFGLQHVEESRISLQTVCKLLDVTGQLARLMLQKRQIPILDEAGQASISLSDLIRRGVG